MVLWRTSSTATTSEPPGSGGSGRESDQSHAGDGDNLTGGGESAEREHPSSDGGGDHSSAPSAAADPSSGQSTMGNAGSSSSDPDGGSGQRRGAGQRDAQNNPRPQDGGGGQRQPNSHNRQSSSGSGMGPPTQPLFPPFSRDGTRNYGPGYGNNPSVTGGPGIAARAHPPPAPHLWPPGNSNHGQEKKKMKRDRMGNARPSTGGGMGGSSHGRSSGGGMGANRGGDAQRVDVYPDGSGFVTNADGSRTFSRGNNTALPLASTMAGQAGGLSGSNHPLPGGYGFNPPGAGGSAPSSPMFSFAGPQAPDSAGSFGGMSSSAHRGGGGFAHGSGRAMAAVGAPSPMMPADAGVQGMGGGSGQGGGNGVNNNYPYGGFPGQGMNIHQQTISNALQATIQ